MLRWPWSKSEKRESGGDFSDAVVRLIEAQAAGSAADASSTAAVEAASGALSRAFASAEVVSDDWVVEAVTPAVLGQIGRDLVRKGSTMHVIRLYGGQVRADPRFVHLALGGLARSRVLDRPGDGLRAFDFDYMEFASVRRRLLPVGIEPRPALCRCGSDKLGAHDRPAQRQCRAQLGR